MLDRTLRIRALNDKVRRSLSADHIVFTPAVCAQSDEAIKSLLMEVQTFEEFSPDNDPLGEHDFGKVQVCGVNWFWRIDYYKRGSNLALGSDDPSNVQETERVLTIMRADEY